MRAADNIVAGHGLETEIGLQRRNVFAGFVEVKIVEGGRNLHVADPDRRRRGEGDHLRRSLGLCSFFGYSFFRRNFFGRCFLRNGFFRCRLLDSRRRRYGDCGVDVLRATQELAAANHFGIVEMSAAAAFQLGDPGLEYSGSEVEHFQQRRRRGARFMQPGVEHLLHGPARFAQIREADHAAAALQRMEAATHRDQRFMVARCGVQLRQLLIDGGQHFVGFLEEYTQQLGIEVFLAGFHHACGFCRWGRGFDRRHDGFRRELGGCFETLHFEVRQYLFRRWLRCNWKHFKGRGKFFCVRCNRFRQRRHGRCHRHQHNRLGFFVDGFRRRRRF